MNGKRGGGVRRSRSEEMRGGGERKRDEWEKRWRSEEE